MENLANEALRNINHYENLVNIEKEEELKEFEEFVKKYTPQEREKLFRAITNLKAKKYPKKYEYHIVKFEKRKKDENIKNIFSPGDVVVVSSGNPLSKEVQKGTIYKVGKNYILVLFEEEPKPWIFSKKNLTLDLYPDDVTFKRWLEALEDVKNRTDLYFLFLDKKIKKEDKDEKLLKLELINKNLNIYQQKAVKKALLSKDFFLIHGPPGTGKTTTLVEIILQLFKLGKKILVTADSNTAVDNLLERVSKYLKNNLVRVGHLSKVSQKLEKFFIFHLLEKDEEYRKIRSIDEKIEKLKKQQEKYLKPLNKWRRGLSNEEIKKYAREGKKVRGISLKKLQKMAKWISIQEEISKLFEEKKKLEDKIITKILKNNKIIFATNSMVYSDLLKNIDFDVAVIDEGSQATLPSTLMPILKSKKFIIAGDHKQLPPTVKSLLAKDLEKTLFEKLISLYPEKSQILKIQYRMNEKIMEFPNKTFYNGELIADKKVRFITLKDIIDLKKFEDLPSKYKEILSYKLEDSVTFIDIRGKEKQEKLSKSYYNKKEVNKIVDLTTKLIDLKVNPQDIGIITPYLAQVKQIKKAFEKNKIFVEVNTVDGFQGKEKEVILISFVRSNSKGELGFLEDLRRLNVAITRPKRKLIMVGNKETLSTNLIYKNLIKESKLIKMK
ncbi:MAG TPA: IGHMBP2 family helicase [Desulfurobacteriaceae bacterium]|nr:IGHMBP2 family helicase [Desulfurobacteriaceae bacterium]